MKPRTSRVLAYRERKLPASGSGESRLPIVGAWIVKAPKAPFPFHMFVFHADGTVQQSNPDAGNSNTSDSSAMGVWVSIDGTIKGKVVEITADRKTRRFVSRGEISFAINVNADTFIGTANATFYNSAGKRLKRPTTTPLSGQRIQP